MKDVMKAEIKVAAAWKKVNAAQAAREKAYKALQKVTAAKLDVALRELDKAHGVVRQACDKHEDAMREFSDVLREAIRAAT